MDPSIESAPVAARPKQVTWAVGFLLISIATGLIASGANLARQLSGAKMALALLIVIAFFAVYLLLTLKISARKNWARIILLVLVILDIPFAIPAYLDGLKVNKAAAAVSIIVVLLKVIGTSLLFTKPSNLWFRTRK